MAPTMVEAKNTSSTSVLVTWQPLANEWYLHGVLRGYRVKYAREDGRGDVLSNTTQSWTREFEIKELNKYIKYRIQVLAFTVKGDGPLSGPVLCTTDQDGKLFVNFMFCILL